MIIKRKWKLDTGQFLLSTHCASTSNLCYLNSRGIYKVRKTHFSDSGLSKAIAKCVGVSPGTTKIWESCNAQIRNLPLSACALMLQPRSISSLRVTINGRSRKTFRRTSGFPANLRQPAIIDYCVRPKVADGIYWRRELLSQPDTLNIWSRQFKVNM